ncbi:hypothetical protein TNCV_3932501 [Trichonephila clavipes]|nr:hypothetical protein TNCV_3932501 [Trichonephila clavipes]
MVPVKTSSGGIYLPPHPIPFTYGRSRNIDFGLCCPKDLLSSWQWKRRGKREIAFEQTSRTPIEENIDAFNQRST